MRSFIGLPIPHDATPALLTQQALIASGRLTPRENLHLTLAFLGDQPEHVLQDLARTLASHRFDPVDLAGDGLMVIETRSQSIVAMRIEATPALARLHKTIRDAVRAVGIDAGNRAFRPHITLSRMPAGPVGPIPSLAGIAFRTTATEIGLYESTLHAGGPRYDMLASFPAG